MKRRIVIWTAGAWLFAAGAFGQLAPTGQPVRVQMGPSRAVATVLAPEPLRIPTAVGNLTFQPGELTSIEFSPSGQCEVNTVYGDRWFLQVSSQILLPMVADVELHGTWDRVGKVTYVSPTPAVDSPATFWTAELNDGSAVCFVPRQDSLRVEANAGKVDLPWGAVEHLAWSAIERLATVEISPGTHAIQGFIDASSIPAEDLGGRRMAIPWSMVVSVSKAGYAASRKSARLLDHDVSCRLISGQSLEIKVPASVLTVSGRGGAWKLPTTRILRIEANPDGTYSVQTTVGEWLTGALKPKTLPVANQIEGTQLNLAYCRSIRWVEEPVQMPKDHLVFRLKTGDLVVGRLQAEPEEEVVYMAAMPVRVRNPAAETGTVLPEQIDGKWTVSQFVIQHWASGEILKLSASAVEAVRPGPVAAMPPALNSRGSSAVRSDEVFVPGGTFQMGRSRGEGAADEIPPVELTVPSFWLANTPVTVAQFEAFVADTRHVTESERTPAAPTWQAPGFAQLADAPVVCVSWRDAVRYCNWRSAKAGLKPCYEISRDGQETIFRPERNGYRLLLEAEWEYAARSGGQDVVYPWGDEATEEEAAERANFRGQGEDQDPWPWTNPVKAFPPSEWGLYDMVGNVWEWCQDVYREDAYAAALRGEPLAASLNPLPGRDVRRVMRGGSYHNGLDYLRCATRGFGLERMNAPRVGFRIARNVEPESL